MIHEKSPHERGSYQKIIQILNQFLENEKPVLFSGKSLNIIINHFSKEFKDMKFDENDQNLDKLLEYWKENLQKFKDYLFKSAKNAGSYTIIRRKEIIIIREDDAVKSISFCPPGPEPLYGFGKPKLPLEPNPSDNLKSFEE